MTDLPFDSAAIFLLGALAGFVGTSFLALILASRYEPEL